MNRYPNISDHGLIGDLQTAALVSTDGTVDWFCCPRFDSPSVFASLLDAARGGLYRVRTRRRGCDLRFGQMSRLRQDRGLCLSGSSICS